MGAPGPLADLSPSALRVLDARYLRRDASRPVIETPTELFDRVARAVSHAELVLGTAREADRWQETFGRLLTTLDFLPNSPALMNAGTSLGRLFLLASPPPRRRGRRDRRGGVAIVFPAGDHHEAVRMAYPEYARLAKPALGEFCTHEREKSISE